MRTLLILAAALGTFAVPAMAADDAEGGDANRSDVRCILGMSAMARNETYKQWGQTGIFYYTGRLHGRDPKYDIGEAIKREYRLLPAAAYNDEIKRCNDALGETSRDLEKMKPPAPRGTGR